MAVRGRNRGEVDQRVTVANGLCHLAEVEQVELEKAHPVGQHPFDSGAITGENLVLSLDELADDLAPEPADRSGDEDAGHVGPLSMRRLAMSTTGRKPIAV